MVVSRSVVVADSEEVAESVVVVKFVVVIGAFTRKEVSETRLLVCAAV